MRLAPVADCLGKQMTCRRHVRRHAPLDEDRLHLLDRTLWRQTPRLHADVQHTLAYKKRAGTHPPPPANRQCASFLRKARSKPPSWASKTRHPLAKPAFLIRQSVL